MVLKNISYLKNKVQMFSHQPSAAEHKIGNISYRLFFSPYSSIQVQTDGLCLLSINWGDRRIEDWSLSSLSWVYWNPNSFSWKNVQSRQWKQISNRTNSTTVYARTLWWPLRLSTRVPWRKAVREMSRVTWTLFQYIWSTWGWADPLSLIHLHRSMSHENMIPHVNLLNTRPPAAPHKPFLRVGWGQPK